MKKVLVTGSRGSLGGRIFQELFNLGYDVRGIDKHNCDLTNANEVKNYFTYNTGFDYIIHCAATIYGVAGFNVHDYKILNDDVMMMQNILKYSHYVQRFVFTSSSMIYESVPDKISRKGLTEPMTELYPAPRTGYGLSKYLNEKLLMFSDRNYTIWRPFNIITEMETSQNKIGYSHVFADYFHNILMKKSNPLPIIGDGFQTRCFTWIDEVVQCIVDNLNNSNTDRSIFNIGNPEPINMRHLAKLIYNEGINQGIIENQGRLTFETIQNIPRDVKIRIPDITKAKDMLLFEPKIKVDESVRRCVQYWGMK